MYLELDEKHRFMKNDFFLLGFYFNFFNVKKKKRVLYYTNINMFNYQKL